MVSAKCLPVKVAAIRAQPKPFATVARPDLSGQGS